MKIRITTVVTVLLVTIGSIALNAQDETAPQKQPWKQYASLEEIGWSADKLAEARAFSEQIGTAAAMFIWRGHVIVAWGDIDRPFRCHSVRKSFLSALYGIAIAEGRIDLDETIDDLGIDDISPLSDAEKLARVEDLIMSRSGIYHPAAKETEGHKKTRPERGSHEPGELWWYNNWDFNLAGVIYEMKTAQSIFLSFKHRIAEPLGMEDFSLDDTWYQWERSLTEHPAFAFKLSARDRAKFGQLFLQEGNWNGEQIVPSSWVEKSTSSLTEFSKDSGYGYMWWSYYLSDPKGAIHHVYAALGGSSQLIMVVPDSEAVFVFCEDSDYGKAVKGSDAWKLASMISAARTGEPRIEKPTLTEVRAEPYAYAMPEPERYVEVELSPAILDRYTGKYRLVNGAVLDIERRCGFLTGNLHGQGEADFHPASETLFFANSVNATARFILDDSGRVSELVIEMMGQKLTAKPVEDESPQR